MAPRIRLDTKSLEVLANDCTAFEVRWATQRAQQGESQIEITNANIVNDLSYARIPADSLESFKEDFSAAFFGLFANYVACTPSRVSGRFAFNLIDKTILTFPNRTNEGAGRFERAPHLYSGFIEPYLVMVDLGITGKNTDFISTTINPGKKSDYTVGFDFNLLSRAGNEAELIERVKTALFPVIGRYAVAGKDKYRK